MKKEEDKPGEAKWLIYRVLEAGERGDTFKYYRQRLLVILFKLGELINSFLE